MNELFEQILSPFAPPRTVDRKEAAVMEASPDAAITKEVSPSSVTYKVKGNFEAVWRATYWLLQKYPAEGYGTRVKSLQGTAGEWEAVVQRAASCD